METKLVAKLIAERDWARLLARAQAAKVLHCNYMDRRWLIYKHGNRADYIECELGPYGVLPVERADIRAALEAALEGQS